MVQEISYRLGYQHGAFETLRAVEQFLNPAVREVVRTWIEKDIVGWRIAAATASPHRNAPTTLLTPDMFHSIGMRSSSRPPTWRLTNLRRR